MTRIDRLVQEFADGVVAQTDAIRAGDHRTGNRCANRYIRAFGKLRDRGDDGRDALVGLLSNARNDVRAVAAAFLLRHRHQEASAILREAAKGEGLVAFGAAQALKRWEDGSWELDPVE